MKRHLLALTLSTVLGAGAVSMMAQTQDQDSQQHEGRRGHRFDPQQRVNILAKRLNLTDDQKQKVQGIFADTQQQMQSIRDDSSLSREDRMAKMKSLREQTDEKINGVLNDDQKQKYAQMKQQAQERMQERMKDHGNADSNK
jgi:Spy/CpxP family protein refolding chaperone